MNKTSYGSLFTTTLALRGPDRLDHRCDRVRGGTGNIWGAFPASVALVAAVLGLSSLPSHKGRDAGARLGKRAGTVLAVAWGLIVCLAVLVLFLVPAQFTLTGGVLTALVAAGAIWGAIAYVDRR